ncbi:hypothetical protein KU306_12165 [Haloferax larsenii]|uniref:PGF-pre-PGF domain-containing protein n=1 Tax=Haloferax larsenii TaxID=302484 RepID=A0ABY5RBW7_HALLR|nr:hypothetical protein [Haloferax larsenii]UVE49659.1 hypothetical protein KU306_12165 [Haloferax larsenii]
MHRVSLITVLSLLLLASSMGIAAAQENATDLSKCNPESDQYRDCVLSNTSVEDVYVWLNQTPDSLSEHQKFAFSAYTSEEEFNSTFSDETLTRVTEWKKWDNGLIKQPEWFRTPLNGTSATTPDNEQPDPERDADAPDTKWRQIRDGQWIVEKPSFDDNGTGTIRVYSEFDGSLAVVDNIDCRGAENGCKPDVTNVDVSAEQVTEITFAASTASNGYQEGTLNSLTDSDGHYDLAVMLLTDQADDNPWDAGPSKWDYVFAFAGAILGFGLLAVVLTAIYIHIKNRETSFNAYDKLHRRT